MCTYEINEACKYLQAALEMEKKKYAKVPVMQDMLPSYTNSLAWGYVVAGYFLLEEALKLLVIARGKTYTNIHNLTRIFMTLDKVDQDVLAQYYRDFCGAHESVRWFPIRELPDFLRNLDAGGTKNRSGNVAWRYSLIENPEGNHLPLVNAEFLHELTYGAITVARHIINPSSPNPVQFTYSLRKHSERRRGAIKWL